MLRSNVDFLTLQLSQNLVTRVKFHMYKWQIIIQAGSIFFNRFYFTFGGFILFFALPTSVLQQI